MQAEKDKRKIEESFATLTRANMHSYINYRVNRHPCTLQLASFDFFQTYNDGSLNMQHFHANSKLC